MNLQIEPSVIVFLLASIGAIFSALLVIEHKSIVYASFFLAMLGASNATLFVLLGYPVVSIFHLVVYVGAAVTFILFSVVMMREAPLVEPKARGIAIIAAVEILLVFSVGFWPLLRSEPIGGVISLEDVSDLLLNKYSFALLVAALALATTMIEAITLARREVSE